MAQAVCEAVQRPTMRFVGVKTAAQQDQQSLAPDTVTGGGAAHGAGEPGAGVAGGAGD